MKRNPRRNSALKYHQVKERVEQMMEALSAGDRLPPERQLARQMDCSVPTVRSALSLLVDEGRLTRCRGRGTFLGSGAPQKPAAPPRRPRTLGVLVHAASDAYALRLSERLTQETEARKVTLHVGLISGLGDGAVRQTASLAAAGCGAVIVPWISAEPDEVIRRFVAQAALPVSLPLQVTGLEANCFESAAVFGVNAVRHVEILWDLFARMAYDRIALLGPDTPHVPLLQRALSAYAARVGRNDRELLCGLVPAGSLGMDALARRWSAGRGELAVICYDDEHAFRFMTAMHKLGLCAPDDYVIAGYNDSTLAAHTDPPLTSMYQDSRHAARGLVRHALALARGRTDQVGEPGVLRLVLRETCGARARLGKSLARVLREVGIEWVDAVAPVASAGRRVGTGGR
jgi:DNA-binding LacI/PurR family transcriptional regulator